jgi:Domain of unknown function (DUF4142)
LRDARAVEFSSKYDPMQVSAHEDSVSLFERYLRSGDNTKLKDWVGKTLPMLRHHLEMAEALQKRDLSIAARLARMPRGRVHGRSKSVHAGPCRRLWLIG